LIAVLPLGGRRCCGQSDGQCATAAKNQKLRRDLAKNYMRSADGLLMPTKQKRISRRPL